MYRLILLFLFLFLPASLIAEEELLRPEQAFKMTAEAAGDKILVRWHIEDGYYLYRNKFRFKTDDENISLGAPDLPPGKIKKDPFFGDIEILRQQAEITLPFRITGAAPKTLALETRSQGCADVGICYPPQTQKVVIPLNIPAPPPAPAAAIPPAQSSPAGAASPSPLDALGALGNDLGFGEDDILTPDQAYKPFVETKDGKTLAVHWEIADGTYLYADKVSVSLEGADVTLGEVRFPPAKIKPDSVRPDGSFGDISVFEGSLDLSIPLLRKSAAASEAKVTLKYQGCAERGICYPPQKKEFKLLLPAVAQGDLAAAGSTSEKQAAPVSAPAPSRVEQSEQDQIASMLGNASTWLIILTFFGIGLLLAFTPCVFPMIPILSGIIAGQGAGITTRKAFTLSVVYVLAMAVTYTIVGVLAGIFGASLNLTAAFQNPWILSAFALLFVLLSLSMFGFYELQLPASWQSKLSELSNKQSGGELSGVAVMGLLSALIVGPCVAPPLAGALIYIGQTGDALLGGAALFAMAMGMGAPLIAIGTSAGKLLPKAGGWMDAVKAVFGVMMLGLAITMLERFLPEVVTMGLWGILFIVSAVYMGALQPLSVEASGWSKLWKGLGVVLLIYGALFLVGVAANGKDNLQPLRGLAVGGGAGGVETHLQFKRIKNVADLERELAAARAAGKPVMLDFYADWCIYCKQMERNVFSRADVVSAMSDFVLLQADVTDQDEMDKALMEKVNVPAPPAMIFWDRDGVEIKHLRLMGYMGPDDFKNHVNKVP
ncbi:protein-disulfide reductase DsbD [Thiolapillus sp.]